MGYAGPDSIDEAALQGILFRYADILPLGEIDPAYRNSVPVCMELGTRAGSADALYLTPTGRIVLAEFKLWRNPEARREVVGQILDYARVLGSWSYDDLDREVRNRTGRSPFDIVSEACSEVEEHIFIDNVARRLKRGEFLLLIIGDGIREGVRDIVAYVQEHSGLRFNLALIEAAVARRVTVIRSVPVHGGERRSARPGVARALQVSQLQSPRTGNGDHRMTRQLTAIVERDGNGYVALCPEVDVASQGDSVAEARSNLEEALALFFETASTEEIERRLRSEVYVTHVEVAVG